MSATADTFNTQGYVVVEDILDHENDIQPLIDDYTALLDRLVPQFYAQGLIPSAFDDLPFQQRLAAVVNESRVDLFKHFDISYANDPITEESPIHLSRPVFNLLHNSKLLDAVEQIIGGEILANPIQHVRIKPPQATITANRKASGLLKQTGWHQDQGVARPVADDTDMVTVWIAITDATVENGCLQVIPYSHRKGMSVHCPTGEMTIPQQLLGGEPRPIPLKAGSAILMHRLTKHASLPNVSDTIRWSFDLRYQPIDQPTGRDEFPSLIVRSRQSPQRVQTDFVAWVRSWEAVREHFINKEREKTHRWDGDAEVCA